MNDLRDSVPGSESASLTVDGLEKRYGDTVALGGISLSVEPGELFGVIGPDGAGKSTLFRILVTVIEPDAGTAIVDGIDIREDYRAIRRRVGYMPGQFSLYMDLTVEENLSFFASVFGTSVEEGYDLIAPIYSQIEPFANRRAADLSGGMKQKLALSCALVHKPRVLILDEPTTGVDAVSRVEFWDMLASLRDGGITTIVSTPYMDEAARCDRVALLDRGQLLQQADTPEAVAAGLDVALVRIRSRDGRPSLLDRLRGLEPVRQAYVFGAWIHVTGTQGVSTDELMEAVRSAVPAGDLSLEPADPSIEDVFIARMTENPANESAGPDPSSRA